MRNFIRTIYISFFSVLLLSACAPKVGSDEWCANLKKNPTGDWTIEETTNYAKHCLLK